MAAETRTLEVDFAQTDTSGSWELVVYERRQRRVFRLPESGVVSIGRAANCYVRLDDASVSRQHARLHLPSMEIEDLKSRNGSWVLEGNADASVGQIVERTDANEVPLAPGRRHRFTPGSILKLGEVLSRVQRSVPVVHTLPIAAPVAIDEAAPVVEDRSMVQLYEVAERVSESGLPLLILGETGVGKDVLAARVHQLSPRRQGPFVRVNCGALTESLLESELFGHQRGAFTGASDSKPGLLEAGNGGTVFLDEIGELPARTQVKLLHVLETSEVTRVGATRAQRIDVRFIAATNRELAREVQAGIFRKDLYFRINTLCLKISPLRERQGDILPLVRHFLRGSCLNAGVREPELSKQAAQHLLEYDWPGNVRELKNAVERARLLCGDGPLLPEHFPTERELLNPAPRLPELWADADQPTQVRRPPRLDSATDGSNEILEALSSCGGNQTRAAQRLGISRRTLVNRLNELDLPRPRKGLR
jgi:two-component system, NtrC family, response regulator AtoC